MKRFSAPALDPRGLVSPAYLEWLVAVQAHLPGLQFRFPPRFHPNDVVQCGSGSRNLQDRHLVIAWLPAHEGDVAAVASLDIVLPATPKAVLTTCGTDILLFGFGAGD